jgi:hypothetical protein
MLRQPQYALSIKQPWATLLLAGLKAIEVRRWPTTIRGSILIHAARQPDPRPPGWAHITDELRPLTELAGGIIGSADLTECLRYRTPEAFTADVRLHRNDPAWFVPPVLYGFRFDNPQWRPFTALRGQVRFFKVAISENA